MPRLCGTHVGTPVTDARCVKEGRFRRCECASQLPSPPSLNVQPPPPPPFRALFALALSAHLPPPFSFEFLALSQLPTLQDLTLPG